MRPQPNTQIDVIVVACFVATWIVLGIGGFVAFYLGKDAAFKRKWFPRYVILAGVLFLMFSTTIMALEDGSFGLKVFLMVLPMISLISYLNIKMTKFCPRCGATSFNQNWFSLMRFCSRCGAALDLKPGVDTDLLE